MDKYKHIVETVAKRVAAKIREANASENNIEEGDAFAPNHYCVHHGGVRHEGKIHMAEAVGHNWNEESQSVTHYDMKLKDGSVLENVAFEDIQVTEASLAKEHNHPMKRDDDEEELEERKKRDNPRNDRGMPSRMKMNEDEESDEDVVEEVEEIEAGAEINESNDQWYQRNLFENLTKKWAK